MLHRGKQKLEKLTFVLFYNLVILQHPYNNFYCQLMIFLYDFQLKAYSKSNFDDVCTQCTFTLRHRSRLF